MHAPNRNQASNARRLSGFTRHSGYLAALLTLATALGSVGTSSGAPDQDDPVAAARTNAQTALAAALAELQKTAGPDQRVTARADILGENLAHPHLTGVWNSWEIKATAPPVAADYERPAKDAKFLGWLVSNPDPEATRQTAFADQPMSSPVKLWGRGSLGATAPARSHVDANRVPVAAPAGAYAWAVLDEGVKARVNTPYTDGATTVAAKTMQLGVGERPGVEFLPGLEALRRSYFQANAPEFADFTKGIGNGNFPPTAERLAPGAAETLKTLAHDVTFHSKGLFTDTARGGLRKDFLLLANASGLPAAYRGFGIYRTQLGLNTSTQVEPRWETLRQYALLYRSLVGFTATPTIRAQAPSRWGAASPSTAGQATLNQSAPEGMVLMPSIARVQIIFSLVARDKHSMWVNRFDSTYPYLLHLVYTPVLTLHNPYNVALEFTNLRVEFSNVPFAVQFYVSGRPLSTAPAPLDQMFASSDNGMTSKRFGMNLRTSADGNTRFRLQPGEVKVFSPYMPLNAAFGNGDTCPFADWRNNDLTSTIVGVPGLWPTSGYDADWLIPRSLGIAANGGGYGVVPLRTNDYVSVLFAPLSLPALSNNRFQVLVTADLASGNRCATAIEINYESPTGLQEFLLGGGMTSWPSSSPSAGGVRPNEMYVSNTTPLSSAQGVRPFALFTLRAKTTNGGRHATKPWSFDAAVVGTSASKLVSEHPAHHSHEIDLLRATSYDELGFEIGPKERGFFASGSRAVTGTTHSCLYDIPLGPVQTLASLNGANPGGGSGYLPRFAQPIGNSWAHPLMLPDKLRQYSSASRYDYLDHSFLLNLALYDGFYLSGLADQAGPFGSGKSAATLAGEYAAGKPLDDPRLLLYRPNGRVAADFPNAVAATESYSSIAAWQLMKGAFNINSTSVPAWKAMLASVHDSQALYHAIDKNSSNSALMDLPATAEREARISRFRLPAALSAADGGESRDGYWLGPREYSDAQLQTLAENIVKQVRLRGPFLSLAEFVNRRLGTGEAAQRGALQQAIDDSNLNQTLATAAGAGIEIPASAVSSYKYANPAAGAGPSYQGAPGFLTQADLLNVLGNAATARSDTFVIRAYGESGDSSGGTTTTAVCEAVVQRLPDWLDPADKAEVAPANLTSDTNKSLGRRFRVVGFRWLADGEI